MAKNINCSTWNTEGKISDYVKDKYPRSVVDVSVHDITYLRKVEVEVKTKPINRFIPFRRRIMARRLAAAARYRGIVGMKYKFKVL